MSADESVRDRVARWLYAHRSGPHGGSDYPWESLTWLGQEKWFQLADALLAAFPEIGLFERLEASSRGFAAYCREADGAWRARVSCAGDAPSGTGTSPAAALSAALDQVETTSPSDDPSAGALADAPLGAGTFGSGPADGEQGSKGQPGGGTTAAGPTPTTNEEGRSC